jgi:hypothetical protein
VSVSSMNKEERSTINYAIKLSIGILKCDRNLVKYCGTSTSAEFVCFILC